MAAFKNSEELNRVMLALWHGIQSDAAISAQLLSSLLIISFYYREPESKITIDCSSGKEMKIYVGDTDIKPIVEMSMRADLAHDFWLGNVNVPLALISGKISCRGPVNRALALLPAIKPAFKLYPALYQSNTI